MGVFWLTSATVLQQFDWTACIQVDRRQLQALFTLEFLARKDTKSIGLSPPPNTTARPEPLAVCLSGPIQVSSKGVGRTMLHARPLARR